ncbi:hypothetical protein J4413_02415 [Candidatus Woesearchaeota archaeon]|nr:hypothetical protein [Candidatus Woesearchaeota archaeon]
MTGLDEERIRNSFEKVRKDMSFLKKELESVKLELNRQKEEEKGLKLKIDDILRFINEIKDNMSFFYKISSGNDGVINNHQQSSTIINNEHQSSSTNNNQPESINDLKEDFESLFRGLTDREFSVFMAIYQLEEDLHGLVRYSDVSKMLKITQITVRNYVNSMISMNIPIEKHRQYNRKVSLSIKKELRDLNLATKLLKLRQSGSHSQKTLFE